jgi:hypothetical protein
MPKPNVKDSQSPAERFEALAKRLLAVPKAQVDAAREKAKRESKRKRRSS